MSIDYLELANKLFQEAMEETLNEDRNSVGAAWNKSYDIEGSKFTIKVDGCWEKSTWFDWSVKDEKGNLLKAGHESV